MTTTIENQYYELLQKYNTLEQKHNNLLSKLSCDVCGKQFNIDATIKKHKKHSKICKTVSNLPTLGDIGKETYKNM